MSVQEQSPNGSGEKEAYEIIVGDCLDALKAMPDKSVHCIVTSPPYFGLRDYGHEGQGGLENNNDCLAWARSEEPCDGCYICWVRKVAHELHRVLRDDGTLWWNIGDSYNGSGGAGGDYSKGGLKDGQPKYGPTRLASLKQKDLCMIPARTALALQADGWYLRQDIIWAKDSCMPESVKDRCTKAHEYIYLFAKQSKYRYDADAIREAYADARPDAEGQTWSVRKEKGQSSNNRSVDNFTAGKNLGTLGGRNGGRNKRSVWRVNPKPYKGAHFAVYPPELIEPCILAGTSAMGCCSKCGAPHQRITKKIDGEITESMKVAGANATGTYEGKDLKDYKEAWMTEQTPASVKQRTLESMKKVTTTIGWRPTCECDADTAPCVVLDPFLGSGTTIEVALKNGRRAIGIELNPEYAILARERLAKLDKTLGLSDEREWL